MEKQRIVFVNIHKNHMLVKALLSIIFKKTNVSLKHRYFLDYLLSRPNIEVCSYIDEYGSSFRSRRLPLILNKLLSLFSLAEHNYVIKKNNINKKKVTVLHRTSDLTDKDIIILYCTGSMYNYSQIDQSPSFKAVCFLHIDMTSFNYEAIKNMEHIHLFFNESDLRKFNPHFRKDFTRFASINFIVNPFVFQDRFKPIQAFKVRENRAVSMGTIGFFPDKISQLYKSSIMQPMRKEIKDNATMLEPYIACFNSSYEEGSEQLSIKSDDKFFTIMRKRVYNLKKTGKQEWYFSFDMVEKFNEFKMCIVGEDITGVPGIGFVEGMACGCAYIGLNSGIYEQYGLKDGVHYIGYNGTLPDLTEKIKYWQRPENQERLEEIAQNGCAYVRSHFNKETVASQLLSSIIGEYKAWNRSKNEA